MLTPSPLPEAPEAAAAELAHTLAGLAARERTGGSASNPAPGRPVAPRGAALSAFRRHLARMQSSVQEAFEQGQITGVAAAQRLAALTDGLIAALYDYAASTAAARDESRRAEPLAVLATG